VVKSRQESKVFVANVGMFLQMSNYTYTRQCRIWNRIITDEVWEALIVAKMVMFCLK